MATLIGLCIRVKLLRCLPARFKVDIEVRGGHGRGRGGGGRGPAHPRAAAPLGPLRHPLHGRKPARPRARRAHALAPASASLKPPPQLTPGSHMSEAAVNKQLNDKERVAAALENPPLLAMVDKCLASAEGGGGNGGGAAAGA
jgi:hypothetical protein